MRVASTPRVISSVSEKSFSFAVKQCMRVNRNGKPDTPRMWDVEQRVCFRIFANCLLKCVKHQLVVIASAYDVGDNRPVIEIEDGAQIELLNDRSFVPFEFCHVRCPLLVRPFCLKIPVKDVL